MSLEDTRPISILIAALGGEGGGVNFRGGTSLGRAREAPRVDLTPLIDIVFLLLIFFLITTTFTKEKRPMVPLQEPEAQSAEKSLSSPSFRDSSSLRSVGMMLN